MANYYFIKGPDGYYDQQKELILNFIDQKGYTNVCFLHDTLNKMSEIGYLGKALIKRWGKPAFSKFLKTRTIDIGDKTYSFGTVKTLEYSLDDFDVIVHIYSSVDSILNSHEYTYQPDHIFAYWVQEQPKLDEWMAILGAQKIRQEENIQSISWSHLDPKVIAELDRINQVNVGDGGTHPGDESLIKEVVQKINKKESVLDAATFKAYLIREIRFKPSDAEKSAYKVRNYLK